MLRSGIWHAVSDSRGTELGDLIYLFEQCRRYHIYKYTRLSEIYYRLDYKFRVRWQGWHCRGAKERVLTYVNAWMLQ